MRAEICDSAVRNEGRILFTLLDAADCLHLLQDTAQQGRWHATKLAITRDSRYDEHAVEMLDLLMELRSAGVFEKSWIGERLSNVMLRIEAVGAMR